MVYLSSAEPVITASTGKTSKKNKKKAAAGGADAASPLSQYCVSSLANNLASLSVLVPSTSNKNKDPPQKDNSDDINSSSRAVGEGELSGIFVLYGVPAVVAAATEPLCGLIGGKGGGRPGRLQGMTHTQSLSLSVSVCLSLSD